MLVICSDLVLVATVFGRIRLGRSSSKLCIEQTSAAFLGIQQKMPSLKPAKVVVTMQLFFIHRRTMFVSPAVVRLPAVLYHEIRSRMCRSLSLEPLLYDKVMKGGGLAYAHSFSPCH